MAIDLSIYFNTIKIRYSKVPRNLFEINGPRHIKQWMETWMGNVSPEQHQQFIAEANELAGQTDEKWWKLANESFTKISGYPMMSGDDIKRIWVEVPKAIQQQLTDLDTRLNQYLRIMTAHQMMLGMMTN